MYRAEDTVIKFHRNFKQFLCQHNIKITIKNTPSLILLSIFVGSF